MSIFGEIRSWITGRKKNNTIVDNSLRVKDNLSKTSSECSTVIDLFEAKQRLINSVPNFVYIKQDVLNSIIDLTNQQINDITTLKSIFKDDSKLARSFKDASSKNIELINNFFRNGIWSSKESDELKTVLIKEDVLIDTISALMSDINPLLDKFVSSLENQKMMLLRFDEYSNYIQKELDFEKILVDKLKIQFSEVITKLKQFLATYSLGYSYEQKIIPTIKSANEHGITVDQLVFVHMTDYFPENGIIKTHYHATGDLARFTLHFTINEPVDPVEGYSWDDMKYSILIPGVSFPIHRILNLSSWDTYIYNDLKLPRGTIILLHENTLKEYLSNSKYRNLSESDFIDYFLKTYGVKLIFVPLNKTVIGYADHVLKNIFQRSTNAFRDSPGWASEFEQEYTEKLSKQLGHKVTTGILHAHTISAYLEKDIFEMDRVTKILSTQNNYFILKDGVLFKDFKKISLNPFAMLNSIQMNDDFYHLLPKQITILLSETNDYCKLLIKLFEIHYDLLKAHVDDDDFIKNYNKSLVTLVKKMQKYFYEKYTDSILKKFYSDKNLRTFEKTNPNITKELVINYKKYENIMNKVQRLLLSGLDTKIRDIEARIHRKKVFEKAA